MDPESITFQPRDDMYQFRTDMLQVQRDQADLIDRVARLERKQEEDSRLKNVWGTSSPFPSVLGGTPQQVPLQQPTAEHFSSFDDHPNSLIGNLQLDADEEPRRVGATSRANSVRFDETANHGHWAHASRSSLDLIARTGSGMGGHALSERSYSHKSDGRQSSAGHSVPSATSGRANSLTGFGLTPPIEPPALAPGLFILGSVPAIIRCWLNTDFKHGTLLYAAVCSGSYASYLDLRLVEHLGFQDHIVMDDEHLRKIELSVHLPEAVPVSAASLPSDSSPQLPSIAVEFTIIEEPNHTNLEAIQIFLGSDVLRAHHADVLLSSNRLSMYDDDHSKVYIPLVRPEEERAFNTLSITSAVRVSPTSSGSNDVPAVPSLKPESNEHGTTDAMDESQSLFAKLKAGGTTSNSDEDKLANRRSVSQHSHLHQGTIRTDGELEKAQPLASGGPRSAAATPAIWSSWRRDHGEKIDTDTGSGALDWATVGRLASNNASYQRRDTGIKVLKPSRSARTMSTSTSSPVNGQSRFFDDGKRRDEDDFASQAPRPVKVPSSGEKGKENIATPARSYSANPVGGASAFAWLNSGRSK